MAKRTETAKASAAEAKWAKRIARFERSGLSIRAFAARDELKAGSLSFWRWKLAHRRPAAEPVAPLRFVELTAAKAATVGAAMSYEVALASGRTVRVPSGFDGVELARLVAVLEEARR